MGTLLSLDIGNRNIHVAEGSYAGGVVKLRKAGRIPIETDIVSGSAIVNFPHLRDTMRTGLSALKTSARSAVVTINGSGVLTREFTLPDGKPEELARMARNEMINTFNIGQEDIVEYTVLNPVNEPGVKSVLVRAAAVERRLVEDYLRLLRELRLKPAALDMNTNAVTKLFAKNAVINGETDNSYPVMYIDLGASQSIAYVIQNGRVEFFRILPSGFSELDRILSSSMRVTLAEAEAVKKSSLNVDPTVQCDLVNDEIRAFLVQLSDQLNKIMHFYYSSRQNFHETVGSIYLSGGGSRLAGLAAYMQNAFNIHTERFSSVAALDARRCVEPADMQDYVNAAGALIRL